MVYPIDNTIVSTFHCTLRVSGQTLHHRRNSMVGRTDYFSIDFALSRVTNFNSVLNCGNSCFYIAIWTKKNGMFNIHLYPIFSILLPKVFTSIEYILFYNSSYLNGSEMNTTKNTNWNFLKLEIIRVAIVYYMLQCGHQSSSLNGITLCYRHDS